MNEPTLKFAGAQDPPAPELIPTIDWRESGESDHFVQFYESDDYLADSVSRFFQSGIEHR